MKNFTLLFLLLMSLSQADEFDMFDEIDKTEDAKAFDEEKNFVTARLKLNYQYNEESDNAKAVYLNLNKNEKNYQVDVRVVGNEDETTLHVKELYYKGEFSPTNLFEVGRINVKEGVARGYNPSDFFKGSTSFTLSSDPKEIRDNRLGSVMMQNTLFFDDFTFKAIYSPKISVDEKSIWGSKKDYGLHLDETNYEGRQSLYLGYSGLKDVSASLIFHHNKDADEDSLGLNLSYVKNNWIVYTEGSLKKGKNDISNIIERLNLSPTVQNSLASDKETIQKAVVGVNYTYDNISTNFEYIFNSSGLNNHDWNNWFDLAQSSPQIAGQLGEIRGSMAKREEIMSRDSFFIFSRMTDIQPNLDASAMVSINPYDKSTLSQIGVEYALKDDIQTNVYLRNYQGANDTEYGSFADNYQILIEGEYFF